MKGFKLFSVATAMAVLWSCTNANFQLSDDYDYVFDRNGRVNDYRVQEGKPFVANLYELDALKFVLSRTDHGKIDRFIKECPDWEFVFYCGCHVCDSSALVSLLDKYDCNFPVILDSRKEAWVMNDENCSGISHICRRDGKKIGYGVIGVAGSDFDRYFDQARCDVQRKK